MHLCHVKKFKIGKGQPLTIICGPCVIEGERETLAAAKALKKLFASYPVNLIFKSSYDKANRSSYKSFRGPGLKKGLKILAKVQKELDLAVVTDVHSPDEAKEAAEVVDMLQIPAFLCRQTDLITAAARTGKPIQVKKGQFLAPWDMKNVVDKIRAQKNHNILLVDRGTTFGYNNLVSDMRAIPVMQSLGHPVCFDATHSVQLPGGLGDLTGGQREFILVLARAALASGADSLFIEAHPNPSKAKSDAASQLSFDELEDSLEGLVKLHALMQGIIKK